MADVRIQDLPTSDPAEGGLGVIEQGGVTRQGSFTSVIFKAAGAGAGAVPVLDADGRLPAAAAPRPDDSRPMSNSATATPSAGAVDAAIAAAVEGIAAAHSPFVEIRFPDLLPSAYATEAAPIVFTEPMAIPQPFLD